MTASLAGSKQMLHSNVARSRSRSLSPLAPPLLLPLGPSPSLLPPAVNPPLLAGPPSLEDRGPAAAIVFNVQVRKLTHHNPTTRQNLTQANISSQKKLQQQVSRERISCCRATWGTTSVSGKNRRRRPPKALTLRSAVLMPK